MHGFALLFEMVPNIEAQGEIVKENKEMWIDKWVRSKSKFFVLLLLAGVMMATGISMVYAIYVDIDTNDGLLDPDWDITSPNPFITDTIDSPHPLPLVGEEDILAAWVGTSGPGPSDYLYFRVRAVTGTREIEPLSTERINVIIDCDNDDNILEMTDLVISYGPHAIGGEVLQLGRIDETVLQNLPATDAEVPGDAPLDAEWRVLKSDIAAWGCTRVLTGTLDFVFISTLIAPGPNNDHVYDATTLTGVYPPGDDAGWNSPTALRLQEFGAQPDHYGILGGALLFIGSALTGGTLFWRRRAHAKY